MKKSILICLLAILCSCNFTKKEKAESLVKNYLKERLNDPNSYEIVSFGELDTNFSDRAQLDTTIMTDEKLSKMRQMKKINGWLISHTYRAKNGFGALGLHSAVFSIDSAFTKIVDMSEMGN